MKKTRALFCVLLILCCMMPTLGLAQATSNLITNGSFELLDADNQPIDWSISAYRTQVGYSRLVITDEKAHSGSYSALIENATLNDARFTYTASVQPSSLYRLSGYILVEKMEEDGKGANFGIENVYTSSIGLFDTAGEWQYVEYYGETSEDQTTVTFGARIGGYSAESEGKAYFDDIALEKVDAVPNGVIASLWYKIDSSNAAAAVTDTDDDTAEKSTALFILCGLLFALAFLMARPMLERKNSKHATIIVGALMFAALVLRFVIACTVKGYEVDINCFHAWSLRMANEGPMGFYAPDAFCDYPPGYMLMLWPIGMIIRALNPIAEPALYALVKFYPIICDIICAIVIYAYAKKHISNTAAMLLAALFTLNPAALVNGAAWGQVDSVLALFMILIVIFAMDRKWHIAIPLFFVAILMKPQALLFAPMACVWLAKCLIEEKEKNDRFKQYKQLAIGFGVGIAAALAIIIPFAIKQENPFTWIFKLYGETLSSYSKATLNTANLYYLLAANWVDVSEAVSWGVPLATALAMVLLAAWQLHSIDLKQKPLDWKNKAFCIGVLSLVMMAVQLVFICTSVTYEVYGYTMMAFVYLLAAICLLFDPKAGNLPFYLTLVLIGIYVLGIKVHERYLFAALPLLLIGYVHSKDRRMLWLFVWLSVTTFINTAIVLDNSILYGSSYGHLNDDTLAVNCILGVSNMLLCLYAGWIALSGTVAAQLEAAEREDGDKASMHRIPSSYQQMLLQPKDARMHLRLKDYAIMGVVSVLYAVLAFSNLGSTVAPQDGWISTSSDEQVIFELDDVHSFNFMYYAGVSHRDFTVSVSEDGQTWSNEFPCEMRQGLCYRWLYLVESESIDGEIEYSDAYDHTVLWLTGKYLRINATSPGLNLFEIVVTGEEGQQLPLALVEHSGTNPDMVESLASPENLINEQDTYTGKPSWYNGTYFDEIYHARTAYEHLHGEIPYETTHPPLGKLMMSAGIAIFGMTPFGWRFAGALVGVLMLPALYLFAMQLTKRRDIAAVSMLALTFDLMHFTQTRIATIDSFPVLFILLSYLCMARYLQTDVFAISEGRGPQLINKAFKRSLIPLALSGLFMGISIACKWIGIYSALGLAVLFFIGIYRQYRVSNVACGMDVSDDTPHDDAIVKRIKGAQEYTLKRILITCGCCVIFFILVPCVIYYLSYIPYLLPSGKVTIGRVIDAQISMLDYHSTPGLGMDHPYQSPWWQWPLILKPMWFNRDTFEPAGYASTIFCMGNPWIFYIGAACMVAVIVLFVCKYIQFRDRLTLRETDGDLTLLIIVIGFMAQYLPWVLVPRSMYIYHYFASVPFVILATSWLLGQIPNHKKQRQHAMVIYILGAIVFFIMFFPYASGLLTSTTWLDAMKWFPGIWY